jgi:hypothetical protein
MNTGAPAVLSRPAPRTHILGCATAALSPCSHLPALGDSHVRLLQHIRWCTPGFLLALLQMLQHTHASQQHTP